MDEKESSLPDKEIPIVARIDFTARDWSRLLTLTRRLGLHRINSYILKVAVDLVSLCFYSSEQDRKVAIVRQVAEGKFAIGDDEFEPVSGKLRGKPTHYMQTTIVQGYARLREFAQFAEMISVEELLRSAIRTLMLVDDAERDGKNIATLAMEEVDDGKGNKALKLKDVQVMKLPWDGDAENDTEKKEGQP